MAQRFLFLTGLILLFYCSVSIFGAVYYESDPINTFDVKKRNFNSQSPVKLTRHKRDAAAQDGSQPSISKYELNDDNHQRAIISWSGVMNSSVCFSKNR